MCCKLTSQFTMQWSWLRNKQICFQMNVFAHSFKFYEILSCHWWWDWSFNSVLCYKVQLKIKQYKAIVQCSKNQTIKTSAFILQSTEFAKLHLNYPSAWIKLLIQQRKSRSIRWNSVLKTDEEFLSMIWIRTQHKILDVKLSIS